VKRTLVRVSAFLSGFALLVFAFFHFCLPPVYDFPEPEPFAGPLWYDPYGSVRGVDGGGVDGGGVGRGGVDGGDGAGGGSARGGSEFDAETPWLRVNLHAHAFAWGGLTRGEVPLERLYDAYRRQDYDVIGISNYMSIRPRFEAERVYLSVYEHGFGALQQHQTVVGSRSVDWFDFPFYQGTRQKQFVLDRLVEGGASLVILNHPDKNTGYTARDLSRMTGYVGMEVRSRHSDAQDSWDAALSAGRPVWGFCSDDLPDLGTDRRESYGWIRVQAAELSASAVLRAIRRGRFYGVWARNAETINELVSSRVTDDRLDVRLLEPADSIRFIGQGGTVVHEVENADTASYPLGRRDTYVRVEAHTGVNVLYLNPVFRYDRAPLKSEPASVVPVATWALRVGGGLAVVAYLGLGLAGFAGLLARSQGSGAPRAGRLGRDPVPSAS